MDTVLLDYGLRAQGRMLPWVFGFFGVGLPVFVWTARLAQSPQWLAFYLFLFTVDWTAFMVLKARVDKHLTDPTDAAIRRRLWMQGAAGGLWAITVAIVCLCAGFSGQAAEPLVMVCAGAAVGVIFFSSPVLLSLLILGPLAAIGPILASRALHPNADFSQLMTGGMALAMAMGFVLNRHMREHYRLQHRQMELADEREAARAATDAVNAARMALMETLQREVQTGLKGVENNLLQGLNHLTRAPAPRGHVDAALNEISHLQAILTTTFDNDTAAAGRIEVEHKPLDAALICERMTAQFSALAQSKGLGFTLNTHGLPPEGAVLGDEHRVEQILAHLLSNALLYTRQGRVELKLVLPEPGTLRIEVVDSGPGLDEDELTRAFAPHVRILRTSSGHSGAGLGLSLSKSLAELMGGRLGAQSTPDVGSKFWLDLPFDAAARPPVRPAEETGTPDEPAHSLRVLLLSNDSLRAAQLRDQLEHLGHKCLTSTSRERALALARKAPVDACLISTGAFEDLREEDNRARLRTFFEQLRSTQHEAGLAILALLPEGDQIEDLQALGIKPLLLPQNRDSLGRALAGA
jgi:signal transduction histidine kinase/CheY-like chemotaxis protein